MAMIGGSVTVSDSEAVTGSGLALALYQNLSTRNAAQLAAVDSAYDTIINDPTTTDEVRVEMAKQKATARLNVLRGWANTANDLGPPIVAYLQANAEVPVAGLTATVATSAHVGRLPAVLTPGDPIDGPASPVALPVGGVSSLPLT